MLRFLILCILCTLISSMSNGQKASEKVIEQACECIKNYINKAGPSEVQAQVVDQCLITSLLENKKLLKKEFKIKADEYGEYIGQAASMISTKFTESCPETHTYKTVSLYGEIDLNTLHLDEKTCFLFHNGAFRTIEIYVNNMRTQGGDTTHYTLIQEGYYYRYKSDRTLESTFKIQWKSGCEWEIEFVKSNNPKATFKVGEKENYKVIGSLPNGNIYVKTNWSGYDIILLLEKFTP